MSRFSDLRAHGDYSSGVQMFRCEHLMKLRSIDVHRVKDAVILSIVDEELTFVQPDYTCQQYMAKKHWFWHR